MVDRIIARAETLDTQSFRGRRVPEYQQDNVREIGEQWRAVSGSKCP
jgi:hypothetical protein